jgi:hypothetical protein
MRYQTRQIRDTENWVVVDTEQRHPDGSRAYLIVARGHKDQMTMTAAALNDGALELIREA